MTYDYLMPPTIDEINEINQKQKAEKAKLREEKRKNETPKVAEVKPGETVLKPVVSQIEEIIEEELVHGAAPDQQPLYDDELKVENNT
ncbi:hypothetical protein IKN40_02140 [bacterium]|nr:hypothetical protein [bacterium]